MTPHIHTPADPRVFVFGSNLLGIHGAGAALYAARRLGARKGVAEGMASSRCYALPTCWRPGIALDLDEVATYVQTFLQCARMHPDVTFFVSAVGCGFAGFAEHQIAPMFRDAPANCDLPPGWRA